MRSVFESQSSRRATCASARSLDHSAGRARAQCLPTRMGHMRREPRCGRQGTTHLCALLVHVLARHLAARNVAGRQEMEEMLKDRRRQAGQGTHARAGLRHRLPGCEQLHNRHTRHYSFVTTQCARGGDGGRRLQATDCARALWEADGGGTMRRRRRHPPSRIRSLPHALRSPRTHVQVLEWMDRFVSHARRRGVQRLVQRAARRPRAPAGGSERARTAAARHGRRQRRIVPPPMTCRRRRLGTAGRRAARARTTIACVCGDCGHFPRAILLALVPRRHAFLAHCLLRGSAGGVRVSCGPLQISDMQSSRLL